MCGYVGWGVGLDGGVFAGELEGDVSESRSGMERGGRGTEGDGRGWEREGEGSAYSFVGGS